MNTPSLSVPVTSIEDLVAGYKFQCPPGSVSHEVVISYGHTTRYLTPHNLEAVHPFKAPIVQGNLLLALIFSFHQMAVHIDRVQLILMAQHSVQFYRSICVGQAFTPVLRILSVTPLKKKVIEVTWQVRLLAESRDGGGVKTMLEAKTVLRYLPTRN